MKNLPQIKILNSKKKKTISEIKAKMEEQKKKYRRNKY